MGEIPVGDEIGREIITRFDTDIESNGIFYTDSNGREMLKRKRNHRDTWNVTLMEEISGNYYPVTAKIAIEDDNRRFAILNDRAQGGSSLNDGSIELMVSFASKTVINSNLFFKFFVNLLFMQVHRRLLHDDAFGVGEALNEMAYGKGLIARGSHYLVVGSKKRTETPSIQATERFLQLQTLLPSWLLFSNVSRFSYDDWKNTYTHIVSFIGSRFVNQPKTNGSFQYSGLSLSLPLNIHLLTFEPWKDDSILIRFEHILANAEDDIYSQAVTFNFQDVFRGLNVASIRETTLSANQWLNEAKRFNFSDKSDRFNEIPSSTELLSSESTQPKSFETQPNPKPEILPQQYFDSSSNKARHHRSAEDDESDFKITMKPMEIRTFVVELE